MASLSSSFITHHDASKTIGLNILAFKLKKLIRIFYSCLIFASMIEILITTENPPECSYRMLSILLYHRETYPTSWASESMVYYLQAVADLSVDKYPLQYEVTLDVSQCRASNRPGSTLR